MLGELTGLLKGVVVWTAQEEVSYVICYEASSSLSRAFIYNSLCEHKIQQHIKKIYVQYTHSILLA